jgi:hypothetical protein
MFNDITVKDNEFHKKAKNELGKIKINHEISFYLYVQHIDFPMPKLLLHQDGFLSIEYIKNARTLIDAIDEPMINTIKYHLQAIHNVKKQINRETMYDDLNAETNLKIMKRYHEYDWTIIDPIRTVNHIQIHDVYYYCDIIKKGIIYEEENNEDIIFVNNSYKEELVNHNNERLSIIFN